MVTSCTVPVPASRGKTTLARRSTISFVVLCAPRGLKSVPAFPIAEVFHVIHPIQFGERSSASAWVQSILHVSSAGLQEKSVANSIDRMEPHFIIVLIPHAFVIRSRHLDGKRRKLWFRPTLGTWHAPQNDQRPGAASNSLCRTWCPLEAHSRCRRGSKVHLPNSEPQHQLIRCGCAGLSRQRARLRTWSLASVASFSRLPICDDQE